MITRFLFLLVFIYGYSVFAQQSNCKVATAAISESYSGDCKKGLAHGKGIARGIDMYEGQFSKGMPDGKGTYKWADGTFYEGQWKKGMREGTGKMTYRDSIVTGYWKEDKYIGEKFIPPYIISYSTSVSRSSIIKSAGTINGVRIRILQGGGDNTAIQDFSLVYTSGDEYRTGNVYGIQNTLFPLDVKVRYSTWNQFRTSKFNVLFEFTINDPGTWDVVISN
jgi:hypothetical protein